MEYTNYIMRVVVYGLGNNFTRHYHWISRRFEIVGLVDADKKKLGQMICGFSICSPNMIPEFQYDKILVTPFSKNVIREQLHKVGVDDEQIMYLEDCGSIDELPESEEKDCHEIKVNDKWVRLAFVNNGGAGNQFVLMNFIFYVAEYLQEEPVKIDIFASKSSELNEFLSYGQGFFDRIRLWDESAFALNSDVLVELDFFPFVLKESFRVKTISPKLHELLDAWRKVSQDSRIRAGRVKPDQNWFVYKYALDNNVNNLNILDVRGKLGVTDSFLWHPILSIDDSRLEEFGLQKGEYITVQRGATPGIKGDKSPKIWPYEYYTTLIDLLHAVYPQKKIVQLGKSDNSRRIYGVDVDLLDKTGWPELAVILENAWLHIDGECGMVHLRASLTEKPSVVIFGSTSRSFYGYDFNINLRSSCCKDGCARQKSNWQSKCAKDYDEPKCLTDIKPSTVLNAIVMWDRLEMVRQGNLTEALAFCNDRLMSDESINIDEQYSKDFLCTYNIYFYEKINIAINELFSCYFSERGLEFIKIDKTKAYRSLLKDDSNIYENYVESQRIRDNNTILSARRFNDLKDSIIENGYDGSYPVIVDEKNIILDGQHRAAIMAYINGTDSVVNAVRIYTLNEDGNDFFPYKRIPKGSRILIYGFGIAGKSYLKQMEYTHYCDVVGVIDKKAKKSFDIQYGVYCMSPEEADFNAANYVVVASRNKKNINEIYMILLKHGIDESKIICHEFGKDK